MNPIPLESLFLAEKFHQRFSDTCPIDIPSFCLLITKDGLIYLKNNSIDSEEKCKKVGSIDIKNITLETFTNKLHYS